MHRFPSPRPIPVPRGAIRGELHAEPLPWDQVWGEDAHLHAFLDEEDREGRLEAAAAAARPAPGSALRGVPVGVKDVIRVDGLPTRAGSRLPPDLFAGPQAVVVDRLLQAGAIVAGKTVTAEFALSDPGPTVNPLDPRRTPGGSSSGSAAAVGAGLVPLAIGTQTVGSVIRPAAYCGVVGFRPTWGLVPTDGVIPNAPSLDTIGWFTSSVAGCITASTVLCGWPDEPTALDAPNVVGVPSQDYLQSADPAARDAFESHLRLLDDAGLSVQQVPLPVPMGDLHRHLGVLQRFELARVHEAWRDHAALYRPGTAAAVREGQGITEAEYAASTAWRDDYRARLIEAAARAGITAWATPAATGLPPLGLTSTGDPAMSAPFSLAGMPAISVPAPPPRLGVGYGLQLAAPPGGDRALLALATVAETALATARRPQEHHQI